MKIQIKRKNKIQYYICCIKYPISSYLIKFDENFHDKDQWDNIKNINNRKPLLFNSKDQALKKVLSRHYSKEYTEKDFKIKIFGTDEEV